MTIMYERQTRGALLGRLTSRNTAFLPGGEIERTNMGRRNLRRYRGLTRQILHDAVSRNSTD